MNSEIKRGENTFPSTRSFASYLYKATVTVVDIDSSAEENIVAASQGSATGLNLRENQKMYFGGLPTIGNYRYTKHINIRVEKLDSVCLI